MTKINRLEISIHNAQTGEIEIREMNDTEFAQWQADQTAEAAKQAEAEAKAAQKAALLAQLGLTQEQFNLLVGN